MQDIHSLLNLPLGTLLVLASGYVGYVLAFVGKNRHHSSIDVAFISLSFGFVAKLTFEGLLNCEYSATLSAVLATLSAIIAAGLWRKWLERLCSHALRKMRVSISNGSASAWDHIRHRADLGPTQIAVRKKNGKLLMCERIWDFRGEPTGPCIYGNDGSVGLYVTAIRNSPDADWREINPRNDNYGSAMTFIPADEISEIEVRHKK